MGNSCPDILQEFCEQQGLELDKIDDDEYKELFGPDPDGHDDGSHYGDNDSSTKAPKQKPGAHTLSVNENTEKLQSLVELLNEDKLSDERDKLQAALKEAKPDKQSGKESGATSSIKTVLGHMATNNMFTAIPPGAWSDGCIHLAISQVHTSLATAPSLLRQLAYLTIVESAITWQVSRSLRLLYRWYIETGPALVEMLVDTFMESPDVLDRRHPQFAPLVRHCFGYVKCIYDTKLIASQKKGKKKNQPSAGQQPEMPSDFEDIPDAVLKPIVAEHKVTLSKVTMHKIAAKNVRAGDNAGIQRHTQEIMLDILCKIFIHPSVDEIDRTLNPGRKKTTIEKCIARCLIRALVLEKIVDFCGGEDGILATPAVRDVIQRPSHIFEDRWLYKEEAMVKHMVMDPYAAGSPLRQWLEQYRPASQGIITISKEIGDIVWQGACQINGNAPFLRAFEAAQKPQSRYKHKGAHRVCDNCGPLIPQEDGPLLGILAVMLREKLNQIHHLPYGNEHLGRILQGKHPVTSSQSVKDSDIDHYDPIRHDNIHINLIRERLGVNKLLTGEGICAIVTWFLTGQGSQTVHFAKSTNMFFTTLEQAEAAFKNAQALGYKCDNTMVWGQPCSQLALCAYNPRTKKKLLVQEKLAPFFTEELCEAWTEWLGGLAGFEGDPWEYTGFKHSWDECLVWVEGHGLAGLGAGSLTAMQLTNTFSILGYIHPPTAESMAHWVKNHPGKGAYRGLLTLGFDLNGRPKPLLETLVLEAFQALYQHFDTNLCAADRTATGFDKGLGVIFVEHFLCKVVRWARRFTPKGRMQLHIIGRNAQTEFKGEWKKGANISDQSGKAFPIPMKLDSKYREKMEARLQTAWENYMKL